MDVPHRDSAFDQPAPYSVSVDAETVADAGEREAARIELYRFCDLFIGESAGALGYPCLFEDPADGVPIDVERFGQLPDCGSLLVVVDDLGDLAGEQLPDSGRQGCLARSYRAASVGQLDQEKLDGPG